MLSRQICVFNKKCLGYQPKKNQNYLKNYFVKVEQSYDPNRKCNYYRAIGHLIYACPTKKDKACNMTWVPQETNKVWVLKTSSWFLCVGIKGVWGMIFG